MQSAFSLKTDPSSSYLSQRDCKPRGYDTIRDFLFKLTPSFIAARRTRGWVSRAVNLQRKIRVRDCSQSKSQVASVDTGKRVNLSKNINFVFIVRVD